MSQKGLQQQVLSVSYMVPQHGNWISRDTFNFAFAHFLVLRSGHVQRPSDEPADFTDFSNVPDGRLSIYCYHFFHSLSVTGFTFEGESSAVIYWVFKSCK